MKQGEIIGTIRKLLACGRDSVSQQRLSFGGWSRQVSRRAKTAREVVKNIYRGEETFRHVAKMETATVVAVPVGGSLSSAGKCFAGSHYHPVRVPHKGWECRKISANASNNTYLACNPNRGPLEPVIQPPSWRFSLFFARYHGTW